MLRLIISTCCSLMGNGASLDQETFTENLKNSKITHQTTKDSDISAGACTINFTSEIKRPVTRREELPDISSMDDDEAYDTVCGEIDQALAGHYTVLLSNQQEDRKPTLQQLEKLLEEQGYKNPDLTDATQRQLVKSYILKKKHASPAQTPTESPWPETPNQRPWYETPTQSPRSVAPTPSKKDSQDKLISEVLLNNRAFIAGGLPKSQVPALLPIEKHSLSKLRTQHSNMPPLAPIGIEGTGWVRPDSLIAEEAHLRQKYKIDRSEGSSERIHTNDGRYHPQVIPKKFDASKFAAANTQVNKNLDVYSETTYKKYKSKMKPPEQDKQVSQEPLKRATLSNKDVNLNYDPSEEALLAAIESEFK